MVKARKTAASAEGIPEFLIEDSSAVENEAQSSLTKAGGQKALPEQLDDPLILIFKGGPFEMATRNSAGRIGLSDDLL